MSCAYFSRWPKNWSHTCMTMRLRHVKYFLALCEEQNFTRAAKRCGIAQPSLTNAIKKLEELVGGSLFNRTRTSAKPTDLALAVKPYFERADLALETAYSIASKRGQQETHFFERPARR